MAEPTSERLTRLLALLALLAQGPPRSIANLARQFGVTEEQIGQDVDLLWVSGAPGYWPQDLIDFDYDAYDEGVICLTNDQGIGRPLRLSLTEAAALLAALQALRDEQHLVDAELVDSTLRKLADAAGGALDAAIVTVDLARQPPPPALATAREALLEGRRLAFRYVSADDEVTHRRVDPIGVFTDAEHWLLQAWCLDARAERYFRLDRMSEVAILDEAAGSHPELAAPDPSGYSGTDATSVRLRLAPDARGLADDLPVTQTSRRADGSVDVWLDVATPAWLRALVLGHGGAIEVIEPPEWADQVRAEAVAALANYDDAPANHSNAADGGAPGGETRATPTDPRSR